jgi:hypothetical protein
MVGNRERRIRTVLFIFIVLTMLLFFERSHPLVILDTDDWTYISSSRAALPSRRFWNPARILPELLMPYASGLAVLLFKPLGFVSSITVMNGIVLSLFIAWYSLAFYKLLAEKLKLRSLSAALLSCLFLLLHFLIFRTELQNNEYMFRAKDVTCIYYYTIPGMLNCGLVMRLMTTGENRRFFKDGNFFKQGLLAAAAYLAVFSNLFESVILAAYCGLDVLRGFFGAGREKGRAFWKSQAFNLAVLFLWAVSVFMEGGGERAEYANAAPFLPSAIFCLHLFLSRFLGMNRMFLLLMTVAVGGGVFLAAAQRRKGSDFCEVFSCCAALFVLCAAFEVLLCAKVRIDYITRTDALFGVYSLLLTMITLAAAALLMKNERLIVGLPLLLIVLFSITNTGLRTFMESNDLYAPAQVCTALDNAIIEQVTSADKAGEEEVTVYVFDSGSEDNWPHTLYIGPRIAASLYKHGVTQKLMTIHIVKDISVNESLHVMTGLVP